MKKPIVRATAIIGAALVLCAVSAQAQWTYFDVIDGVYHSQNSTPNTFNFTTGSATDWITTSDGTLEWRFRNTGPGPKAWLGNAYQGRYPESDIRIYSLMGPLSPNTEYYVLVYGVYPQASTNLNMSTRPRWGAEFSLDGGTTWELIDNRDPELRNVHWVDNSTPLGNPLDLPSGDTRFFSFLRNPVVSDASGIVRIDIRLPQYLSDGTAQDRFVLDGFAIGIPEPTTLCLLGGFGLLVLRLRRRQ